MNSQAHDNNLDALVERSIRRVQEYLQRGLNDAAEAAAITQAKRTPHRLEVWVVASMAHAAAGHLRAAEFAIERALAMSPKHAPALFQHARVCMVNGKSARALRSARKLLDGHVLDLDLGLRLIEIFDRLGELELTQQVVFRLQSNLSQESVPLMLAQAEAFALAGDNMQAIASYEELLRKHPRLAYAQLSLTRLRKLSADEAHQIERLIADVQPGTDSEIWLKHAAFRAFDALGEHARAAPWLAEALAAKRARYRYDPSREKPVFEALKDRLTEMLPAIAEAPALPDVGPVPIFVLGMPGSGAALIERVLGNHPDVVNGGELPEFAGVIREMCGNEQPVAIDAGIVERFGKLDWDEVGRRYRERLRERFPNARMVTDQNPLNHVYAAAIARALPEARIVHVMREPIEQCFALLREHYEDQYPFSNEQSELVQHYLAYADWMRAVESALPKRLQTLRYEQWRAVPGLVTRALFRFCELQFDNGYEDPSANHKPIGFGHLSRQQSVPTVAASESWRNYKELIAPMRNLLIDAGLATRD